VIATVGTPQVLAAKQATASIPIVSAAMGDPLGTGLVANLARPGGNVTGLSAQAPDLSGKRLELLREAVPGLQRIGLLGNVGNPLVILELRELETAGRALGLDVVTAELRRAEDIAPAIDALKERADALYVAQDLLTVTTRHRINILALAARLPVMHASRENIEAGGLISYGPNYVVLFRRAADYVDKLLRGAKAGDLPIEQPTTFELVLNLTTARALGLTIPPTLLARADEVIE
jgi:putative ABC transport system substrate-binding protein